MSDALDRCKHDLMVDQCADCRSRAIAIGEVFDDPAPAYGPWIEARWPGECAGCGERFEEGDRIRNDGCGYYLAECCGSDA